MKTSAPQSMLLIIGLLAAGVISSAQTSSDSCVKPKASAPDFTLEAGPGYFRTSDSDIKNFIGDNAAFGWRIAKEHKVQIEVGYYASNTITESYSQTWTQGGEAYYTAVTAKLDMTAVPVLIAYNYCISLGTAGRSELRLAPTIGLFMMKARMRMNVTTGDTAHGVTSSVNDRESNSATTYAAGAGVGYACHFSRKFYLDAGIRYLRTGKTDYTFYSLPVSMDASDNFSISAAFGWKF